MTTCRWKIAPTLKRANPFAPALLPVGLTLLLVHPAAAQQTAPAAPRPGATAATAYPPREPAALLRDARLASPVTLESHALSLPAVLTRMHRDTSVRLFTDDQDVKNAYVSVACRNRSAAAVMDAIAALYLLRWQWNSRQDGYRLIAPPRNRPVEAPSKVPAPPGPQKTQYEQAVRAFDTCYRSTFPRDPAIGGLGTFPSWSNALDSSLLSLLTLMERQGRLKEANPYITIASIGNLVRTNPDRRTAYPLNLHYSRVKDNTYYSVEIWSNFHMVIQGNFAVLNSPPDSHETDAGAPTSPLAGSAGDASTEEAEYAPVKFELSPEEARRQPALKQLVQVRMTAATFGQVLRFLHDTYGIDYLCDPLERLPQAADIDLGQPLPLGDALDRLTGIYHDTEWEYRKSGVLLVRGPQNPARGNTDIKDTTLPMPAPPSTP